MRGSWCNLEDEPVAQGPAVMSFEQILLAPSGDMGASAVRGQLDGINTSAGAVKPGPCA